MRGLFKYRQRLAEWPLNLNEVGDSDFSLVFLSKITMLGYVPWHPLKAGNSRGSRMNASSQVRS